MFGISVLNKFLSRNYGCISIYSKFGVNKNFYNGQVEAIYRLLRESDKMLAVSSITPQQKESYYKMRFIHSLHDIEERVFIALKSCGYIDCKLVALNNLDQIKDLDLKTNDVAVRRAVEEEFGFEIPVDKIDQLKNPRRLAKFIADYYDIDH